MDVPSQPNGVKDSRKTIAIISAIISAISAIGTGSFGYSHAKGVFDAAEGGQAGLDDYITVGNAFWDAAPIGITVAIIVALVMKGNAGPWLYPLAGLLLLAGGYAAANLDPAAHLQAFYQVVTENPRGTPAIADAFIKAYGALAALLAAIAGGGAAVAGVQLSEAT